ncbi:MAG: septum formation family protein [Micrococcales bacterium]|nr:septum formation family protein [Micrococcales bacterium]MCL2668472.1 septum formation family protein [Micrococcales bacterium]
MPAADTESRGARFRRVFRVASVAALLVFAALTGCQDASERKPTVRSTESDEIDVTAAHKLRHRHPEYSDCSSDYICIRINIGGRTPPPPDPVPDGYTLQQDIAIGTCFDVYSTRFDLSDAKPISCETPHALEAVGAFTWSDSPTRQNDGMIQSQVSSCWDDSMRHRVSTDRQIDDASVDVWFPSATQISAGATTGYCMARAHRDDDLLVGSVVAGTYEASQQGTPIPQNIKVGTCYNFYIDDPVAATEEDCGLNHWLEVVDTFTWVKAALHRADPLVDSQVRACWDVISSKIGDDEKLLDDSMAGIWYPTAAQISSGQTTGYCTLFSAIDYEHWLLGSLTGGTYRGMPTDEEGHIAEASQSSTTMTCGGGSLVIEARSLSEIVVVDTCKSIVVNAPQSTIVARDVENVTINSSQVLFGAQTISGQIVMSGAQVRVVFESGEPLVVDNGRLNKIFRIKDFSNLGH